jgi:hypothetical protein
MYADGDGRLMLMVRLMYHISNACHITIGCIICLIQCIISRILLTLPLDLYCNRPAGQCIYYIILYYVT